MVVGSAAGLFLVVFVLVIPKPLLENPLRRARTVRRYKPD